MLRVGDDCDAVRTKRSRRRSIDSFSMNALTLIDADKGLERLKNSKATLDGAKIEAQRTLAPILDNMRRSRRIKSAELVLKKMTGILEYPIRMRQSLERGDLDEVRYIPIYLPAFLSVYLPIYHHNLCIYLIGVEFVQARVFSRHEHLVSSDLVQNKRSSL